VGPAAHTLEARRKNVSDLLRADPALKYAYDVIGIPPKGPAAGPVSVVLAFRDTAGVIVTGDLAVPADRWDMAAFVAYWDAQGRPS
jgi:hypothetical protein